MHEIITIQLGQQSNYVATHFWNAQESYFTYSEDQAESPVDHDIHFRPGLAPDGTETFMPRTVIYDLKGAFGTLRKINPLYEVTDEANPPQALWNAPPALHLTPPIPESAYQASLNAGLPPPRLTPAAVRFFSDYSRVFYHPRSVVQLPEQQRQQQQHPASSAAAPPFGFGRFAAGEELFAALDREHDLLDRDLRPFVEEADHMQGVVVLAGWEDAWGGFAARYVERVRDEYGKVGVWVCGLEGGRRDGVSRETRLLRLANKARTLTEVYKQASIVVPLAVPDRLPRSVQLDRTSQWHTSALLASAVESALLPSRLRDPAKRETLGGMAEVLNTMGKQSVAGLQMSFARPGPGPQQDSRQRKLSEEELSEGVQLDISFAPSDSLEPFSRSNGLSKKPRVFSQLISSRGYGDEEAEEVELDETGRRIRRSAYEPVTKSYNSALQFPLLDSFPEIFRDDEGAALTGSINITSSLSIDSSVSTRLKLLRSTVIRSIGIEDRESLGNELMEMADEYHEGWSSGSDEGEDD